MCWQCVGHFCWWSMAKCTCIATYITLNVKVMVHWSFNPLNFCVIKLILAFSGTWSTCTINFITHIFCVIIFENVYIHRRSTKTPVWIQRPQWIHSTFPVCARWNPWCCYHIILYWTDADCWHVWNYAGWDKPVSPVFHHNHGWFSQHFIPHPFVLANYVKEI